MASAVAAVLLAVVTGPSAVGANGPTIDALPAIVYDAHRGGGMEVRENSLSGMQKMLDSRAVQVLDLDTQVLGDGTLVLMHDVTVDRTTNRSGSVLRYDAASWRDVTLDLGRWLVPPPAPEPAPTLADALDRFGGRVVMTAEAKNSASVDAIAALLRQRGLTDSVYVNTNDPAVARHIHGLGLRSHLWRSAGQMRTDHPTTFAGYVDLLDLDINASDADFVRGVKSGVPRVWAHTLTTRAQRDRALRLGADGIITDDPFYVLGRTSVYPRTPVLINIHAAPTTVQVSDASFALVLPWQQSGPALMGARPYVTGGGVVSTASAADPWGRNRLTIDTRRGRTGRSALTVTVPAGARGEQSWGVGSTRTSVTLTGEDLQLRRAVRLTGRTADVKVRTLDSAARAYTGVRRETGAARTVAGLSRALLTLTITKGGSPTVLHTAKLAGVDTGNPTNGDGSVHFRWRAPAAGTYTAVVTQRGTTYAPVSARTTFRVR
jgi:glycerophosphoryl diester phosphodiesterase